MTETFRMDKIQPRLLDQTRQGLIGRALDRPEGRLKVAGQARYAAEMPMERLAHGVLVRSTITRGRVSEFQTGSLDGLEGVLGLWHGPKFLRNAAQGMAGAAPVQPADRVDYYGQPIALVVAESFEVARDAALRLKVTYEAERAEVDPRKASEVESEDESFGDLARAMADGAATLDRRFTTPPQVAAAMEPHACIAEWSGDRLTLHGALQMLQFNRKELADSLGIPSDNVRLLAPYVGGGFGSKLGVGPEAVAASLAARDLGRPVRVVLSRQQVFDFVLRRTETKQRLRLAADENGKITGLAHDDRVSNLPGESFSEPVNAATHFLYGGTNRSYTHEIARIHRPASGSVRAPGEAVGMLALEAAIDEMADTLGIDPLKFRLQNLPETHPETGQPYSSRALAECLEAGAAAFGWADRWPAGSRSEGPWLIGMGLAAAGRKNMLIKSSAKITLTATGAIVETDMTDIGTGTYAILTQITGEMLGLSAAQVQVRLGDTALPPASGSGGSFGASSVGSAVFLAAKKIRGHIAGLLDCAVDDLDLTDGLARGANREARLDQLIETEIVEEATIEAGALEDSHFQSGFGATFAEVAVHADTGEVRVRRMAGTFAAGRILNEKTAASQCIGGMVWGIGAALTEELLHDPRTGHVIGRDFANYHIPCHADVPQIEVTFLDERDDQANPLQSKGIGELGISGAGAAVMNAVAHAIGLRLYDYPATPDRVISALEKADR
ncbi:xanthine dehydrogenase family protein molybdopterin-binding subunit [Frigidibacter sp. MR17.14]|uniref:xanthine dehydrogenase family protein molybdopterin-binding subunit n=1 Tax=Frigidibacter sp. MR17.14 TaxID=3126509 RepID=UPI003012DE1E